MFKQIPKGQVSIISILFSVPYCMFVLAFVSRDDVFVKNDDHFKT